ncbi:HNH endonuclease signature motif containing protein (plasmid) [Cereibacter azotoformans]|uniref:HNH endonuclease signature motif containing protein n=1 Tax=Cereibacter azotoformans TaxID=43057 RepID=UPI003B21F376
MPGKPPRICGCGRKVPAGLRCECQAKRDAERKARFDKTRPSSSARGYTSKWERARADFLAAHPFCRRCGAPATVVDHIIPHRGDLSLFWDRSNWQPLCAADHNSAKQIEERRAAKGQWT